MQLFWRIKRKSVDSQHLGKVNSLRKRKYWRSMEPSGRQLPVRQFELWKKAKRQSRTSTCSCHVCLLEVLHLGLAIQNLIIRCPQDVENFGEGEEHGLRPLATSGAEADDITYGQQASEPLAVPETSSPQSKCNCKKAPQSKHPHSFGSKWNWTTYHEASTSCSWNAPRLGSDFERIALDTSIALICTRCHRSFCTCTSETFKGVTGPSRKGPQRSCHGHTEPSQGHSERRWSWKACAYVSA